MAFVVPLALKSSSLGSTVNSRTCICGPPLGFPKVIGSTERGLPPLRPPQCSDLGLGFPEKKVDESLRIGVISTRWNAKYVNKLAQDVKEQLAEKDIKGDSLVEMQVAGSFELPVAARLMCAAQKVDAVVCVGVLIKGETGHYEYISQAVTKGLMDLQLTTSIPMILGVLTCNSEEEVDARTFGDKQHAKDWALTAIEMGQLRKSQMGGISAGKKSIGF